METIMIDGVGYQVAIGFLKQFHLIALARGTYEGSEAALVPRIIQDGDRVLEFGAGMGFMGRLVSRYTDPKGVICYEPNPDAVRAARLGFSDDGIEATVRHKLIVGKSSEVGKTALAIDAGSFLASRIEHGTPAPDAAGADLLNDVLLEWRPSVLIVDVEGAEDTLFDETDLPHVRTILIELHPDHLGVDRCCDILLKLRDLGFEIEPQSISHQVLVLTRLQKPRSEDAREKNIAAARLALDAALKLAEGSNEKAALSLQSAIQLYPKNPFLQMMLATALPVDSDERHTLLYQLTKNASVERRATQLLAEDHLVKSAPDSALFVLQKARHRKYGYESMLACRAYLALANFEQAMLAANQAAERLPQLGMAHALMARSAIAAGSGDVARRAMIKVQVYAPDTPDLDYLAGKAASL